MRCSPHEPVCAVQHSGFGFHLFGSYLVSVMYLVFVIIVLGFKRELKLHNDSTNQCRDLLCFCPPELQEGAGFLGARRWLYLGSSFLRAGM